MTVTLAKHQHAKYFQRFIHLLPNQLAVHDSIRLTMAFFALSGLDVLNSLDVLSEQKRSEAIEWIYRLQVRGAGPRSGFQGSTSVPKEASKYQTGHLAMTYLGLASLLTLGDDLSRIDKKSIIQGVRACQNDDGSFTATLTGSESDMRFIYCACCISAILDDWSGIDKRKAINYIKESISYDGGIGQGPGLESHGGSTFCAVASLLLMDNLTSALSEKQLNRLRYWCLMRQIGGFHGRPNKPEDTCYSFWVGATLQILGVRHLTDATENRAYVLTTQDSVLGGLSKFDTSAPDPLHTYLGLCGLSLLGEPGLQAVNAALNISQSAFDHLEEIHKIWAGD
ncbi:geranylgeranyl transferase type-1 subunit beta [Neodiprion virginianus]|uniref:Geranylgeranyl transferase type-1 subunit beta n=1 Tax=Neodiprion lecontei TaxID=441921 RepID=A0A6J0CCU9_NEOLC|nr:geranylgeranyl transferase type-1 subunit beta [Neodiprion lecontei]XP_046416678.1 geranylgeranyl transferase type-1 subunit beta [Neodiprion fabricii]XP_046612326.1 geranylgeranyl transferase type-1 subunit beta [Neodiprion virginianus]